MKFAYFLGCTIPARANSYDASAQQVAAKLDIEIVPIEGASCCPPVSIRSLDFKSWITLAARNLVLIEKMGLDVVTLCNGCYETLKDANHILKTNENIRNEVNEILEKLGMRVYGVREVKQFTEVLCSDYAKVKLKEKMVKRLDGLKVAVHYGCHLLRPSKISQFDNPEMPQKMDELVELTGAKSIEWKEKLKCCGAPVLAVNEKLALDLARQKLLSAKEAGAHCLVTPCPFCGIQFDLIQLKIEEIYNESIDIPMLFLPQLLGLSLGIKTEALGLDLHRVPLDDVLEIISI
ncbi:MAG TPA: CoB--CoM heterodisulfide reductase iron-sulfur subunit B family protein [Candidatus Deferrimicrobium sp.]|nr:CoB--CoM heterodisulfide reductase iron-sulfur subunit B family protein [Candidatus Deferrimicrobium sp.]